MKRYSAVLAIGLAAMGGALGMGIATGKSAEGISRQPEAEGKIRSTFMLGLVFIERHALDIALIRVGNNAVLDLDELLDVALVQI